MDTKGAGERKEPEGARQQRGSAKDDLSRLVGILEFGRPVRNRVH